MKLRLKQERAKSIASCVALQAAWMHLTISIDQAHDPFESLTRDLFTDLLK